MRVVSIVTRMRSRMSMRKKALSRTPNDEWKEPRVVTIPFPLSSVFDWTMYSGAPNMDVVVLVEEAV